MKRKLLTCTLAAVLAPWYVQSATAQDVQKPVADLLDVQFAEDGTAVDVSPMQMTVEQMGDAATVYSKEFGRYIATFRNPYASSASGYYKIDFEHNEAFVAAMKDGHTLEAIVMADYTGTIPNSEAKPFSAHEQGGTGFLVSTISGSRQNELTFLPNVTTNGNSTWRWATSGVTPERKMYYHIVGVWNKEEQKAYIYVNGEQKNCVDAQGEWRMANGGNNWFAIGGDPSGSNCANSWPGNIVLARVYDKPLAQEEVNLLWQDVAEAEQAANKASYEAILSESKTYLAGVTATQTVKDQYQTVLTELEAAIAQNDFDAMAAAAKKEVAAHNALSTAERAYTLLTIKVNAVKNYLEDHPDITGAEFDEVVKYMMTEVAPGEEFANGSYLYIMNKQQLTVDEVNAETAWLTEKQNYLSTLAAEMPVADLLDVEFSDDGSAIDLSPMNMTVEHHGTATTTYSEAFGRYIATFKNDYASGSAAGYYRINFEQNEAFVAALKDGHSLEAIVMADYTGTIPNSEAKPFSAHEGGGTGFLVSTISGSRQNELTFLPNVTTNGNSTWRWATSGVVPQPKTYYHIVGVWNKDEQKAYIYVDGEQKNCVDAPGEWKMASGGNNWFAIGGDPTGGSNCANAWPGNIVLARVYDKPLTMGEVALLWKEVKNQERAANNELYINQYTEGYEYLENVLATQGLIEDYRNALDRSKAIVEGEADGDQLALYNEIKTLRAQLEASAAAYAKYQEEIDYVKTYLEEHDDFAGADRDVLESYIYDSSEPNEDYPNGTYAYIWEQHTMTAEQITAETEKVKTMLATAIENGIQSGTEITNMLTNPTFADGFNGWQGDLLTSAIKSTTNDMIGAEAWARNCNMYQTLEGLQDGVYVVQVNAAYRPFNDRYSTYHAGRIYLNDNKVFVPTAYESMIPLAEVVDGQNCYIEPTGTDLNTDFEVYEADELIGYAINGRVGIANAANGGRALNTMVALVTDGKLTVGFENPNEKSTSDWLGISNLHLFYLGSLQQAGEYLDQTLACQADRAKTIIGSLCSDDADYAQKPNCPQAIKDQLQAAVDAIGQCKDNEEKYALIGQFTELFERFMEGRAAYVAMADNAEYYLRLAGDKLERGDIGDELYSNIFDAWANVFEIFVNGSYSTEEALEMAILKQYSDILEGEFTEPKADLLDVEFTADGTAVDVSPMGMYVEQKGHVATTYSDTYNRYVANFQSPWAAGNIANYFKVDFEQNEQFRAALADGHSMEILIKADYEGTIGNAESKPFSAHEGGGTGFLISTISGARQNEITFLPNVTTNGNSTWRWATSGIVPQSGVYYHVVGVWNKEEEKAYVYINGEQKNCVDAQGELRFANGGNNWFAIGGDPSGGSNCSNAWNGDIAIVRVYDKALDRRQVAYLYKHITDEATAVDRIEEAPTKAVDGIYMINGIKVQKTESGLYIINGKKIVVK